MLLYSIIRTIDGMTENIQHISHSMDLSLQSFLSSQFFSKDSDQVNNLLIIGADYHGSVSPCEFAFHPTLSNCNDMDKSLDSDNINYFKKIMNLSIDSLFDAENNRVFEIKQNRAENIVGYDSAHIKRTDQDLVVKKRNEIKNENNCNILLEPFCYGTKMISTELTNHEGNSYTNDLILATKIFSPLQRYSININVNNPNISFRSEKTISTDEAFHNKLYELEQPEDNEFDLDSFRLNTHYTTHYLFQITSIFSMGISLHSQYRRKSKQRKLHFVK
ncbi:uncharacterized protein cubi_03008 [Cryptosporidium ubiquitum]|uniref:Uncharacterized protein n=1 Tax=Cryptosporidium ubiquitum TaxID=857276 RepID=A0A1J4MPH2_9CRYT|nr:uncharacterized protein cubi_03008 [Cryptosporidium ubiquitum]OII74876.1 hypothetical protein cubi_03008 [Cryptosporidium ubiquitum]